jgi:hypothetical protein
MPKHRRLIVVGNLIVRHYVVRRGGHTLAKWNVTTTDGKLVRGPFLSLEEAVGAAFASGIPHV